MINLKHLKTQHLPLWSKKFIKIKFILKLLSVQSTVLKDPINPLMTPLCTLPLWPFPILQKRAFSKFEIFNLYNPDGFFCKIVLANDNLNKFFAFFDLILIYSTPLGSSIVLTRN